MSPEEPDEFAVYERWLSEWRVPAEMAHYLDRLLEYAGPPRPGAPHPPFVPRAWCAAYFALWRRATRVRLAERADFEIDVAGRTERFVIADAGGQVAPASDDLHLVVRLPASANDAAIAATRRALRTRRSAYRSIWTLAGYRALPLWPAPRARG